MTKLCVICNKKVKVNRIKICSDECYYKSMRISSKKQYKDNKEKMKSHMKDYYIKHKAEICLKVKEYRKFREKKNQDYNQPRKNVIRETLVKFMNLYNIKKILTLESEKYLFSKLIPDKKIYVFECNIHEYKKMVKSKPRNVNLFFGDISDFKSLDQQIDFVYLDFCCTIMEAKEILFSLKEKIQGSKLFAVTFCLRCNMEKDGDYTFNLINEIQNITDINLKVLYGESYCDTIPMVTILFENPVPKLI